MTTVAESKTSVITQVYRVWIKATPQAIWDAITKPEWTQRYGYTGLVDYDLRPGGRFEVRPSVAFCEALEAAGQEFPEVVIDGEVLETDPPRRLVTTFRMLMDPALAAEGFSRVTHEIVAGDNGVSRLTVIHEFDNAPKLAALIGGELEEQGAGGGTAWVLSDLKSLLETGHGFNG